MDAVLLSADFSLEDACKSQVALRCGMDNHPPAGVIPRLQAVAAKILQPVLEHYGHVPYIGSFYRSPALNLAVGGVAGSQHTRGEAIDIEMANVSNYALALWIVENLKFDEVVLEYYTRGQPTSGWVHVSYIDENAPENIASGRKNRGKTKTQGKGVTVLGLHA